MLVAWGREAGCSLSTRALCGAEASNESVHAARKRKAKSNGNIEGKKFTEKKPEGEVLNGIEVRSEHNAQQAYPVYSL